MSRVSAFVANVQKGQRYANMGEVGRLKQVKKFETALKMAEPGSEAYKKAEIELSNLNGINNDAIAAAAGLKPQGTVIRDITTEPAVERFDIQG